MDNDVLRVVLMFAAGVVTYLLGREIRKGLNERKERDRRRRP
jgi:hypothetical protein